MKQPAVYVMANKPFGVIYIGVTSDLIRRVWEHKNNVVKGFSHRYQSHALIYFEQTLDIETLGFG